MRSTVVTAEPERAADVEGARLPWQDIAAIGMLALLGLILFRSHVFADGLYIGNPDRLNSNLKILKFHLDGLAGGHLDAWNQFEMLGYDTFALPYTFPSVFTLLAYLIGPEKLYVAAGYQLPVLLSVAGIAAYAFLRVAAAAPFPAFIGAILYQFSALTTLKVSQNDLSFAVFILIPVMMIIIRKANARSTRLCFLLLTALIFLMLHFTFLQKASYAMILAGSYCLYRTIVERDWTLSAAFATACVVAIIGAFPRLYGIASAMHEYSRTIPGMDLDQFADVYMFQAILPSQILRWFDGGIFGRYPSDGNIALQNYLNLTEGFLLYTSSLVPFLLLFGILLYRDRPFALMFSRRNDGNFFFWFLAFTIAVIAVPVVLKLVWLLYLRMDFTHARILIVGLLPLSVIVSLILADLKPANQSARGRDITLWLLAAVLALAIVGAIEGIARSFPGSSILAPSFSGLRVRHEAIARIAMSFIAVMCLIIVIRGWWPRHLKEGRPTHVANYPRLAVTAYWTLGLAIGLQTFLGADFQINGNHTHTGLPFLNGNNYYSSKANFHPPTPAAIAALEQRLDNDNYRSVLLCDADIAGGFCAGHVPEFWRLRVVDGYYGLGVPSRLAALPWHWGVGLRTISHTRLDQFDWPVLSLLNVKYVVTVDEALYRNNSAGRGEGWRPASPGDVKVDTNPLPRHPLAVFLKGRDVVIPQVGLLQPVLIMEIEERPRRDVQFQLAQRLSARGGLQPLRHRPLRVHQVSRGISAKRRARRDAGVLDEIARDRSDLGMADARLPEQPDLGIVRRRRGLKKTRSQLPVCQGESGNDEGQCRRGCCRRPSFQRRVEWQGTRERQQRHSDESGNAEYQEAEKKHGEWIGAPAQKRGADRMSRSEETDAAGKIERVASH
jgi:hypothetical protein